jgi:GTP-binding protein Era
VHKSGFVNIIGRPNVGKSTIMNALVGERMSIITAKPQTTRHRIIGILSSDDFQIVFSDTPGIIQKPAYKMQESLNRFAYSAFDDADVLLFVATADEKYTEEDPFIRQLNKLNQPKFLIYNKTDLSEQEQVKQAMAWWNAQVNFTESFAVSALHQANLSGMLERILAHLPEAPAYYPKDQLTDRPERFFVAEIIREKMLEQYYQEIPYSVEVTVEAFQETKTKDGIPLINIQALIFAARLSQKAIILGKNGSAIKQLGTSARKALETWLEKKVFLELHVKVRENWRDDDKMLKAFGYE